MDIGTVKDGKVIKQGLQWDTMAIKPCVKKYLLPSEKLLFVVSSYVCKTVNLQEEARISTHTSKCIERKICFQFYKLFSI